MLLLLCVTQANCRESTPAHSRCFHRTKLKTSPSQAPGRCFFLSVWHTFLEENSSCQEEQPLEVTRSAAPAHIYPPSYRILVPYINIASPKENIILGLGTRLVVAFQVRVATLVINIHGSNIHAVIWLVRCYCLAKYISPKHCLWDGGNRLWAFIHRYINTVYRVSTKMLDQQEASSLSGTEKEKVCFAEEGPSWAPAWLFSLTVRYTELERTFLDIDFISKDKVWRNLENVLLISNFLLVACLLVCCGCEMIS